jgi:hypothetical protein
MYDLAEGGILLVDLRLLKIEVAFTTGGANPGRTIFSPEKMFPSSLIHVRRNYLMRSYAESGIKV